MTRDELSNTLCPYGGEKCQRFDLMKHNWNEEKKSCLFHHPKGGIACGSCLRRFNDDLTKVVELLPGAIL